MVVSPLEGTEVSDHRLEAGGVQQLGFGPENGGKPLTSGRKPTGAARRLLEDSDAVVMPDWFSVSRRFMCRGPEGKIHRVDPKFAS
jgi:hypothetical protein